MEKLEDEKTEGLNLLLPSHESNKGCMIVTELSNEKTSISLLKKLNLE
jgi:hypothetical protein